MSETPPIKPAYLLGSVFFRMRAEKHVDVPALAPLRGVDRREFMRSLAGAAGAVSAGLLGSEVSTHEAHLSSPAQEGAQDDEEVRQIRRDFVAKYAPTRIPAFDKSSNPDEQGQIFTEVFAAALAGNLGIELAPDPSLSKRTVAGGAKAIFKELLEGAFGKYGGKALDYGADAVAGQANPREISVDWDALNSKAASGAAFARQVIAQSSPELGPDLATRFDNPTTPPGFKTEILLRAIIPLFQALDWKSLFVLYIVGAGKGVGGRYLIAMLRNEPITAIRHQDALNWPKMGVRARCRAVVDAYAFQLTDGFLPTLANQKSLTEFAKTNGTALDGNPEVVIAEAFGDVGVMRYRAPTAEPGWDKDSILRAAYVYRTIMFLWFAVNLKPLSKGVAKG